MVLDYERGRHWCMVFDDNNGGVDGKNTRLHAKNWDVYNSEKEALVKGGYSVDIADKGGNKLIWEVIDDNVF